MNVPEIISLADTWGMHGDVGWGWMILMMFLMVLFWGGIIFAIVWLIRAVVRRGSVHSEQRPVSSETPVQILERRFAEGAITPEDYRARREVLLTEPRSRTAP